MKTQFYAVLFLFVIIFCSSCEKLQGNDGTYTIQGRMLKDCNGEPVANYGITLKYFGDPYGFSGGNKDIASDTTDTYGYYEFKNIPLKYKENLKIVGWAGNFNLQNVKKGDVIIWDFYNKYEIDCNVTIKMNISKYTAADTLYIGRGVNDYHIISPIIDIANLNFKNKYINTKVIENTTTFKIYWCIGKNHFDSLVKYLPRPANWQNYYFETIGNLCADHDTEVVNIP